MRKYFFLFAISISLFYLIQNVSANEVGAIYCDSRPNFPSSPCSECASACDLTYNYYYLGGTNMCYQTCPAGTTPVDCSNIPTDHISCENLQCGDAGTASGNICVQQSSLDSSCVDTFSQIYGWIDNTEALSCKCYATNFITLSKYTKKV